MKNKIQLKEWQRVYVGKNLYRRVTLQYGKNLLIIYIAKLQERSSRIDLFVEQKILTQHGNMSYITLIIE
jgi:hypothetical protein